MNRLDITTKVSLPLEDAVLAFEQKLFEQVGLHPDSFIDEHGRLAIMEDRLDNPNYASYYFPDGSPNKMIVKRILDGAPTEQQIRVINACKELREITEVFKGELK